MAHRVVALASTGLVTIARFPVLRLFARDRHPGSLRQMQRRWWAPDRVAAWPHADVQVALMVSLDLNRSGSDDLENGSETTDVGDSDESRRRESHGEAVEKGGTTLEILPQGIRVGFLEHAPCRHPLAPHMVVSMARARMSTRSAVGGVQPADCPTQRIDRASLPSSVAPCPATATTSNESPGIRASPKISLRRDY